MGHHCDIITTETRTFRTREKTVFIATFLNIAVIIVYVMCEISPVFPLILLKLLLLFRTTKEIVSIPSKIGYERKRLKN